MLPINENYIVLALSYFSFLSQSFHSSSLVVVLVVLAVFFFFFSWLLFLLFFLEQTARLDAEIQVMTD